MSEGSEGGFEYTRPRYSKTDMLDRALDYVEASWPIGFINSKLSSKNLIDALPTLKSGYHTSTFDDLAKQKEPNRGSEVLFITGLQKVTQKEYDKASKYRRSGKIKQIIFLSEDHPDLDPLLNEQTTSYVFEDSADGFFVEKFKAKDTKKQPFFTSLFEKNNKKAGSIWMPVRKDHYYQNAKNLMQLFTMARDNSKKLSKQNENIVWGEYQHPPEHYELGFRQVLPEGIKGFLTNRRTEGAQNSVIDLFSDPAMVRNLKEEGLVDEAMAVGLSDSRGEAEIKKDEELNVQYITEPNSAGIWTGNTWGKIKEYIKNTPQLSENNGFDLVIARPIRGWQIGDRPPFQPADALSAPFEMQYIVLSKMWQITGNNGSLVIQMPHNSHNEARLYVKQLQEAGFEVRPDISHNNNFFSYLRIIKKGGSPKNLPRPTIFRTPGGIE